MSAMSGGGPAAKLFGKDLKIFLGDVELTGFIHGAELEQTPMSVGLTLDLQMPYEVAYQSKPKPPKLKGQSPSYVIKGEVSGILDKIAREMVDKKKGTPHE